MWKLILVVLFPTYVEPQIVADPRPYADRIECDGLGKMMEEESPRPDRKIVGHVCYEEPKS